MFTKCYDFWLQKIRIRTICIIVMTRDIFLRWKLYVLNRLAHRAVLFLGQLCSFENPNYFYE